MHAGGPGWRHLPQRESTRARTAASSARSSPAVMRHHQAHVPEGTGHGEAQVLPRISLLPGVQGRVLHQGQGEAEAHTRRVLPGYTKQAAPRSAMFHSTCPLTPCVSPVQSGQDAQEQLQLLQADMGDYRARAARGGARGHQQRAAAAIKPGFTPHTVPAARRDAPGVGRGASSAKKSVQAREIDRID